MSEDLVKHIDSLKALNDEKFNNLETLIKNNYTNLTNNIKEIKENQKCLQLSDKDQEVEIAKLWANSDKIEKELTTFKDSEREYGKAMSARLDSLKSMPWKIAGICITAMGLLLTIGGLILNWLLKANGVN